MNKIISIPLAVVCINASAHHIPTDNKYIIKGTDQFKTGTHNVYGKHHTVITSASTSVSLKGEAQLKCEAKKPTYETHGEWVVNGTERCYDEVKRRTDYYWDSSGQICTSQTEVYSSHQYMCQPDPKTVCESKADYQTSSSQTVSKGSMTCLRTTTFNNKYRWDGGSCVVDTTAISSSDSQCKNNEKAECESKPSFESKGKPYWEGNYAIEYEYQDVYDNDYYWDGSSCKINRTLKRRDELDVIMYEL